RAAQVLAPGRGSRLAPPLTWAPDWLGSAASFGRWTGDVARYWPLGPERVFAAGIRLGSFFGTASLVPDGDFLPPEDRFFAGGATTVRRFSRNGLGPPVYVTTTIQVETRTADTLVSFDDITFVPTGR